MQYISIYLYYKCFHIYLHILLLCDQKKLEKYISWARIDISTSNYRIIEYDDFGDVP